MDMEKIKDQAGETDLDEKELPWTFAADSDGMRLASEAMRIHLAHIFDPYLAVYTSSIQPLPHQISAVYEKMLPRLPLRYVLADDPGAGKTVMTGLLLKEMLVRGDVGRCLIVSPGSLARQWQDEMREKFGLRFHILTNADSSAFSGQDFLIASLDKLARSEGLQAMLSESAWDLIVVDEAHKMSATMFGSEVKYTKRYRLGQKLGSITRNLLLLTATPHNGKPLDFFLFMALVDPDRFAGARRISEGDALPDVRDVMRRLVKEELLKFDGTPLFPERIAETVHYDLSPQERRLYEDVTAYVQNEFNRADKLASDKQRNNVGFALAMLQRRLASSPEAIYRTLSRRTKRLESVMEEIRAGRQKGYWQDAPDFFDEEDDIDDVDARMDEDAEEIVSRVTAARTLEDIRKEVAALHELTHQAAILRQSGTDRKWDELSRLLQENAEICGRTGKAREKLIIFTEHKDTLDYLAGRIGSLLGNPHAVVTISGGMSRESRRRAERLFTQDKGVLILIATDAAGEGINLQRAHLMINYDLPWNPNRLEQRFGRIHRIGQEHTCHLWNLVAKDTREGYVFDRLFQKIEREKEALGGKVFDILGKLSFDNKPLWQFLVDAVRRDSEPEAQARTEAMLDASFDRKRMQELLKECHLTDDTMDAGLVAELREDMERREAHKLQPHFIASFFEEALSKYRGKMRRREAGRWELTSVPAPLRRHGAASGEVLPRYERICFERAYRQIPGKDAVADLIVPGHPLLDSLTGLVCADCRQLLRTGCIFIDPRTDAGQWRLLLYLRDGVADGIPRSDGRPHLISERISFIEMHEDGSFSNAGYAPYLDYRSPAAGEKKRILMELPKLGWLAGDIMEKARAHAASSISREHFEQVRAGKLARLKKIEQAVRERLMDEIQFCQQQAVKFARDAEQGKKNAAASREKYRRQAAALRIRWETRLREIEEQRRMSTIGPEVIGGALVVPERWLAPSPGLSADAAARAAIERAAMERVMAIERSLGYEPRDVSKENCGYDIESAIPEEKRGGGHALRMIEVKGRQAGAKEVTVTKNEIMTAFNQPESFILAIVKVDGGKAKATYLQEPFEENVGFATVSVTYDIGELCRRAKILYAD